NALPLNLNTTTATTAAHWDWKRHALTVPLEAFVMANNSLMTFKKSLSAHLDIHKSPFQTPDKSKGDFRK
ncbi:TPA: hypothetical protein AB5D21_003922, partial [Vibrio cholerae]